MNFLLNCKKTLENAHFLSFSRVLKFLLSRKLVSHLFCYFWITFQPDLQLFKSTFPAELWHFPSYLIRYVVSTVIFTPHYYSFSLLPQLYRSLCPMILLWKAVSWGYQCLFFMFIINFLYLSYFLLFLKNNILSDQNSYPLLQDWNIYLLYNVWI